MTLRLLATLCCTIVLLTGCAGLTYGPKGQYLFHPPELVAADRAVESARAAGKAAQCPVPFAEAAKLRDDAYTIYWGCNTAEAIKLANQATAKANALCPVAQAPPPPAPAPVAPPPPPAAPTVTLMANPPSIQAGACSMLTWSSTNSTSASISPALGTVGLTGSQQVCPTSTTDYAIAATGAGGTANARTTVQVTPAPAPPPPRPAPRVVDRLTLRINFDSDKAVIRPAGVPELQKALAFVQKHPTAKISIEGHTDDRASNEYNQGLSERRAKAVRDYLVQNGVTDGGRIQTVGRGETQPIADNKTAQGRFQNRRVEILILSE